MTNTTTAERENRRLRAIAWGITLLFHLLVIIAVLTITPLRQTVLGMSPEQVQQVAEQDRAAAERRREREAHRAQQAVPEEFREALKQEVQQRDRGELHEAVVELRQIRQRMEQQQAKAFDAMREFAVERSPEDLERLFEGIERDTRRARIPDAKQEMQEQAKEVRRRISEARKQIEALAVDVRHDAQRRQTAAASHAVAKAAEALVEQLERDAAERREEAARLQKATDEAAQADGEESAEARELAERAERQRQSARVNESLAGNIRGRMEQVKRAADHASQSAQAAAATAVPPDAVNPPEAGTPADDATLAGQSTDELYDTARNLEREIDRRYRDTRAAQRAMQDRTTFDEAQARMAAIPRPERPDLGDAIADAGVETLGDVTQLRETLKQAANQAQLMRADAQQQLAQVDPTAAPWQGLDIRPAPAAPAPAAASAGTAATVGSASSAAGGAGPGGSLSAGASDSESSLTQEMAAARALPGRRFADDAARQGWLYIDTWYVIGPWDLGEHARTPLPPEMEINLDAIYANGKTGRAHHPRLRRYFQLDGQLRWQFIQSESLYIRPPNETGRAIYYAYTEVHSDREREILFAIDIDDRSTLWVNDEEVWSGEVKSYRFGQTTRKVTLKPGFNRILIRMNNDAPLMDFSLVLLASD